MISFNHAVFGIDGCTLHQWEQITLYASARDFSTTGFRRRLGYDMRPAIANLPDLLAITPRLSGAAAAHMLDWLASSAAGSRNSTQARFPTTDGGQMTMRLDPLGTALWLLECLPDCAAEDGAGFHDPHAFDQLTGLARRETMHPRLEDWLLGRPTQPTSIVMVDITKLRVLNDRYGAEIGDHLLRAVALRLAKACREGDVLVRGGGDRFCLMLPGLGAAEARRHAEYLLELLQHPYPVGDTYIGISVCIGIAEATPANASAATLRIT